MSLRRHSSYRESGAQWLANLPSSWQEKRLRHVVRIQKRIAGELGHQVLSITQKGIRIKDTESNEGQLSQDYSKYQLVEPGDYAMNHMDLLTGYIDQSQVYGVTSPDYRVFTLREGEQVNEKYLLRVLQNAYLQRIFYAYGQGSSQLGRWRLPTDGFLDFVIPVPPLDEQVAVANFLDRETAKIDALIAEQQRLIELLQEKRQAVISHAVTKGLNPNAPIKDSGVEWLGEVPEHWTGCRFKHCLLGLTDAEHKTCPDYSDGEYLIVRTSNIRDGSLVLDNAKYTDINGYNEWTTRCTPQAGDIVFTREAPAGEACIIPEGITACLGQRTVLMHPSPSRVTPEYLVSSIYSGAARTFVQNLSQGSTVSHLNMSEIGNMPIALPPLEEQLSINEYTREEGRKFHELIRQAYSLINLLQERRSALISAAVTGQIDVRGLVPEAAEQ